MTTCVNGGLPILAESATVTASPEMPRIPTRQRRGYRLLKWIALFVTLIATASWRVSLHYYVFWGRAGYPAFRIDVGHGSLFFFGGFIPARSEFGAFDPPPVMEPSRWPTLNGTNFIIPLWLPTAAVALATAWLWWPPGRRRGAAGIERSRRQRALYAAVVFSVCLLIAPTVLDGLAEWTMAWSLHRATCEALSCSDHAATAVDAALCLSIAFLAARVAFLRLRWAPAYATAPVCTGCGYDLTGNVSGRCPECGIACKPVG